MKEVKNHGHSIRIKLLEISRRVGQPYQTLLIRYIHERLLYRLSVSEYRDKFCLKGGALLYAFERFDARPTIDIDFLGRHISMDIGLGDKVVPSALPLEYPLLIDGIPVAEVMAYSLETVVAEKFQAMVALGEANSRMKDFFDVYRILTTHVLNEDTLSKAILTTFETRSTSCESDNPLFNPTFTEEPSRIAAWNNFLRKIKWSDPIPFKDVWEVITNRLEHIIHSAT